MIKAALLKYSEAWQNLLLQMGICFDVIEDSRDVLIASEYSLVILNGVLDLATKQSIEKADLSKTAILTTPQSSRTAIPSKEYNSQVINGEKYFFDQPVTFYTKSERIVNGACFLPFNFDEVFQWKGSVRKQFYSEAKEMPTEIVRNVNLEDVFRLIRNMITEMLEDKKTDNAILSWLPEDKPLFIFRVDTDFAPKRDIEELYNMCHEYGISASWFVDVYSEETLKLYTEFEDQEIGLHCDKHYVYRKYEQNERNIVRANQALLNYGLVPRGFAAPFGDWNPALEEVLFAHDYLYSSEFSYAYNCLPIIRNKDDKKLLQIPVHPINPGRLRRSHFTEQEKLNYYYNLIDSCYNRRKPVIIYHHPSLHLNAMIPPIFEYVNKRGFNNITMENYALRWLERAEFICGKKQDGELFNQTKLARDTIEFPHDYERIHRKYWRYWQHEIESVRGRMHFKKNGYPKFMD